MQRLPPEICEPDDDGDNGGNWYDELDGDGYGHQWLLGVSGGSKLRLKETKRGVDLFVHGDIRHLRVSRPNFYRVKDAMRGLRAVVANRNVQRTSPYALLDAGEVNGRQVSFVASLAPGRYAVDVPDDGSNQLFWVDCVGTERTPKPLLEPEVRNLPPKPLLLNAPVHQRRDLTAKPPVQRRNLVAPPIVRHQRRKLPSH
jgi:hypothetical protein